jgi:type VI secretion system secreted protein Hcp
MALNAYLKLDGIKGESTATEHKDEIDVMSFSWGVTQSGTISGGGGGTGKAVPGDFNIELKIDNSSPLIYKALVRGEHIKDATLTLERDGKKQNDYLKYKFEDVMISSFTPHAEASPAAGPQPHLGPAPHLSEADFATGGTTLRSRTVEYSVMGADGKWVTFKFDFEENRG